MTIQETIHWLTVVLQEKRQQYVPVARSAETIPDLVALREKLNAQVRALENSLILLKAEQDKANAEHAARARFVAGKKGVN
jgi:hypothetical protein